MANIMGELEMAGATTRLDTIADNLRKKMGEKLKEIDLHGNELK